MRDLKRLYYKLLDKIDPPPKMKKGEKTELWLKRIDLKYALRYVNQMKLYRFNYDMSYVQSSLKRYKRAKDRKLLRRLLNATQVLDQNNEELYQMVMIRKRIEEELEETN